MATAAVHVLAEGSSSKMTTNNPNKHPSRLVIGLIAMSMLVGMANFAVSHHLSHFRDDPAMATALRRFLKGTSTSNNENYHHKDNNALQIYQHTGKLHMSSFS